MHKLLITALTLCLCACGGSSKSGAAQPESASAAATKSSGHECPMEIEGTKASYEDAPDGAAMVFTTDSGDVAELQRRVAAMADRDNAPGPKHGQGHIPHSARADNVARGARLVMIPASPSDLEALRAHVREHVDQIQSGQCPMMHEHAGPGMGHGHGPHHGDHDGDHDEHHDEHHEESDQPAQSGSQT